METKLRVLLVDDNTSLCSTMAKILSRKGYEVSAAHTGSDAVALATERRFDIIFMDIRMPIMDGVEAHRRIKQVRPESLVVMMTAHAVEDLIARALEDGAWGILYKPLDMNRVIDTIKTAKRDTRGMLILVVDDDPSTCSTLQMVLSRRGFEVGVAHTGEEAVELAKKTEYDLLFIDMKLPTINGLETYLSIREINPRAVAVLITGYKQEVGEMVEEAIRQNAYTCIYKPFDMDEVLALVEEIERRKAQHNGPTPKQE